LLNVLSGPPRFTHSGTAGLRRADAEEITSFRSGVPAAPGRFVHLVVAATFETDKSEAHHE
jgi:hypothetical protein